MKKPNKLDLIVFLMLVISCIALTTEPMQQEMSSWTTTIQ